MQTVLMYSETKESIVLLKLSKISYFHCTGLKNLPDVYLLVMQIYGVMNS